MDKLFSLQSLFNNKLFRIPDYQRGYSWGKEQLTEFWEDLESLPENKDHYTGMITLHQLNASGLDDKTWNDEKWLLEDRDYGAYHIVDGQQRLTTFIILINEIVNLCRDHNKDVISSTKVSDICEHYLYIVKPGEIINSFIFGYEADNPSYKFFKTKILGMGQEHVEETFYTLNLMAAKKFFREHLQKVYDEEGFAGVESIFKKVTLHMKFNQYNIDDDFSVFVTFETMNNRGKKLSNLELLKNRLIYLSTLYHDRDADERDKVRGDINDAWKNIYHYLGMNCERPLDDDEYLQAHWITYFGYERRERNNYAAFLLGRHFTQQRVRSGELGLNDIQRYVKSISNLIPYWYALHFPRNSKLPEELKMEVEKLNRLGFAYLRPLTMVVLAQEDINIQQKQEYLRAAERFIFLHFRLENNRANYRDTFFYGLARQLYYKEAGIDYVIDELNKIECIRNGKLNIDLVTGHIEQMFNREGYYKWGALPYFLYEYEMFLKEGNQAPSKLSPEDLLKNSERDKISIEHIYPQTPNDETWLDEFADYSQEEKARLTNTLGNLLPLSLEINIRLQNNPFSEKKQRYINGSHSEVAVAQAEKWGPTEIQERGLQMADFMAKRWGFEFRNTHDKLRLLGLAFMDEEEDEPFGSGDGLIDDEEPRTTRGRRKKRIGEEQVRASYEMAKQIYENKISEETGLDNLEEMGMNRSSAAMYIACFGRMMEGKVFKRDANEYAVRYYIEKIKEDFGEEGYQKALDSLRAHMQYVEESGYSTERDQKILEYFNG